MSNAKKADPYRRLLRVMIILLVLFVLFLTGYLLLDSYQKGQHTDQQRKVVEANNQMIREYNENVLAREASLEPDIAPTWPEPKATGLDIVSLKGFAVKGAQSVTVTRAEALMGGLMVVNRWHELPADFVIAEAQLGSIMDGTNRRVPTEARVLSLFPNAIAALDQMIQAAGEEELSFYLVRDAFRSMQTQTEKWNTEIARHTARLSGDALTEESRKAVSYPGTSDYQTGLSVNMDAYSPTDPVLNSSAFQDTPQAKWLNENCWKYGYIFRFPIMGYPSADTVDKGYKTGINIKLDTYRFVGIPHALVMREKGLCLEEYIEYLTENQHLAVYEEGIIKYEIFRAEAGTADTQISIPAGGTLYSVSSDNMGGIVCAITY